MLEMGEDVDDMLHISSIVPCCKGITLTEFWESNAILNLSIIWMLMSGPKVHIICVFYVQKLEFILQLHKVKTMKKKN